MSTDFGTDIGCFPDLDPGFGLISGTQLLAQDLANRLDAPALFYVQGYGLGLRLWLSRGLADQDLYALKSAIEAQCELDERVQTATAAVSFANRTLTVTIACLTSLGPFLLVLAVTTSAITIISVTRIEGA